MVQCAKLVAEIWSRTLKSIVTADNSIDDEIVKNICEATIALIPSYGVTDQALLEACTLLDMEGKLYKFPNGIRTVLEHMNEALIEHITSTYGDIDPSKVPRIRDKILCLLEICVRHHASLPEPRALLRSLTSYYLTPSNTCFAMSMVFKIADTMWHLTKDPSTDFNYYTKRITLATIYFLSMLHMSDDTSENFTSTFDFLKRRVENVISFYKFKGKIKSILPKGLGIFNVKFDR
ncbi:hypothetical protein ANAPRD1_00851 [Anaplasma phagocytophilum]|nr:hypothetical protein ANAPRD1_00851 [Anaplasma phagocytophilum]